MEKKVLFIGALLAVFALVGGLALAQNNGQDSNKPILSRDFNSFDKNAFWTQLQELRQQAVSEDWTISKWFEERNKLATENGLPTMTPTEWANDSPRHGMNHGRGKGWGHAKHGCGRGEIGA